jgi:hypothetical protein
MPHLLAKVAASKPALSLISDFTKDMFKSVFVVTFFNSENKVPSSRTDERSCSLAEVSLYFVLIRFTCLLGWKSSGILRFPHESIIPASWSWKVLADGSYSGASYINSYLAQVSNSSCVGLKVGKHDTTPCNSKGIPNISSTLSHLTLMECERFVGFED